MNQLRDPAPLSIVPLFFSENKVGIRSCQGLYARTGMTTANRAVLTAGVGQNGEGGIPLPLFLTTRQNLTPAGQNPHWRRSCSDKSRDVAVLRCNGNGSLTHFSTKIELEQATLPKDNG